MLQKIEMSIVKFEQWHVRKIDEMPKHKQYIFIVCYVFLILFLPIVLAKYF